MALAHHGLYGHQLCLHIGKAQKVGCLQNLKKPPSRGKTYISELTAQFELCPHFEQRHEHLRMEIFPCPEVLHGYEQPML